MTSLAFVVFCAVCSFVLCSGQNFSPNIWTVDTEPTKNVNVSGMTFFHTLSGGSSIWGSDAESTNERTTTTLPIFNQFQQVDNWKNQGNTPMASLNDNMRSEDAQTPFSGTFNFGQRSQNSMTLPDDLQNTLSSSAQFTSRNEDGNPTVSRDNTGNFNLPNKEQSVNQDNAWPFNVESLEPAPTKSSVDLNTLGIQYKFSNGNLNDNTNVIVNKDGFPSSSLTETSSTDTIPTVNSLQNNQGIRFQEPAPQTNRKPTMSISGKFVDHSKKPMFRVKTKFVDQSNNRKPTFETRGVFVDTSNTQTVLDTVAADDTMIIQTIQSTFSSGQLGEHPTWIDNNLSANTNSENSINFRNLAANTPKNVGQYTTTSVPVTMVPDTIQYTPTNTPFVPIVTKTTTTTPSTPRSTNLQIESLYPEAPFPINDNINTNDNAINSQTNQGPNSGTIASNTNTFIPNKDSASIPAGNGNFRPSPIPTVNIGKNHIANVHVPFVTHQGESETRNVDQFRTDPNVQIINPNAFPGNSNTMNGASANSNSINNSPGNTANNANILSINNNNMNNFPLDSMNANTLPVNPNNGNGKQIVANNGNGIGLPVNANNVNGFPVGSNNVNRFSTNVNNVNGFPTNGNNGNGFPTNVNNGNGFQTNGKNANGFPANGNNMNGFPTNGNNVNGFPTNGNNVNGFPTNGNNVNGFPTNVNNGNGFLANGKNGNGFPTNGNNMNGFPTNSINGNGFPTNGNTGDGFPTNGNIDNGFPTNDNNGNGFQPNANNVNGIPANANNVNGFPGSSNNLNGFQANINNVNGFPKNVNNGNGFASNRNNVNSFQANVNNVNSIQANSNNVNGIQANVNNANGFPTNVNNANGFPTNVNNANGFPTNVNNANGVPTNVNNANGFPTIVNNANGFPTNVNNANGFDRGQQNTLMNGNSFNPVNGNAISSTSLSSASNNFANTADANPRLPTRRNNPGLNDQLAGNTVGTPSNINRNNDQNINSINNAFNQDQNRNGMQGSLGNTVLNNGMQRSQNTPQQNNGMPPSVESGTGNDRRITVPGITNNINDQQVNRVPVTNGNMQPSMNNQVINNNINVQNGGSNAVRSNLNDAGVDTNSNIINNFNPTQFNNGGGRNSVGRGFPSQGGEFGSTLASASNQNSVNSRPIVVNSNFNRMQAPPNQNSFVTSPGQQQQQQQMSNNFITQSNGLSQNQNMVNQVQFGVNTNRQGNTIPGQNNLPVNNLNNNLNNNNFRTKNDNTNNFRNNNKDMNAFSNPTFGVQQQNKLAQQQGFANGFNQIPTVGNGNFQMPPNLRSFSNNGQTNSNNFVNGNFPSIPNNIQNTPFGGNFNQLNAQQDLLARANGFQRSPQQFTQQNFMNTFRRNGQFSPIG